MNSVFLLLFMLVLPYLVHMGYWFNRCCVVLSVSLVLIVCSLATSPVRNVSFIKMS